MSTMLPLPKWSKSLPPLPKDWKKAPGFISIPDMPKKAEKVKKPPKPLKRTPLPKPTKPISQIGKRTKERIKTNGTESALFIALYEARTEKGVCRCEICGDPVIGAVIDGKVKRPVCFSHNLSKGRYPEYRYHPKNITIVCGDACHKENDRINAHNDQALIESLLHNFHHHEK